MDNEDRKSDYSGIVDVDLRTIVGVFKTHLYEVIADKNLPEKYIGEYCRILGELIVESRERREKKYDEQANNG